MKTLGELRVGDTFYILNYDGEYISNINKHTISIINEIRIGEIVKYFDKDNDLQGITIETKDYTKTDKFKWYCSRIVADKDKVLELIKEDKNNFDNNYKRILGQL